MQDHTTFAMPPGAASLLADAQALTGSLELPDQTALASMTDAAGVAAAVTAVTEELGKHVTLIAEYVRAECEAGRVVAVSNEDPVGLKGSAFLAARAALPALEHATLALDTMRKCLDKLQTGEGVPS